MTEIDKIIDSLTESEAICIECGKIWSGQQRNRLIDRGLVDPACRGAKPSGGTDRYSYWYALPLTPLGLDVRAALAKK